MTQDRPEPVHDESLHLPETLLGLAEQTASRLTPVIDFQISRFRNGAYDLTTLKNPQETVSIIDVESERMIRSILYDLLPRAAFYGEETDKQRSEWTWVVDPIDGTTNYLYGIDFWGISIALLFGPSPVACCILRPATQEVFIAARGAGAWWNGRRLLTTQPRPFKEALIGTGLPFRSHDTAEAFYGCAAEVLPRCRDIRRIGAASLDLAYLAAGIFQGFWEVDLQPYDTAAGLLLLQETGSLYSDAFGAPYDLFSSRSLVAGHPGVHEHLVESTSRWYAGLLGT